MTHFFWAIILTPVITLCIALGLIFSQSPKDTIGREGAGLDFNATLQRAPGDPLNMVQTKARDGATLRSGFAAGPEGSPLLVLVHGSGWHGGQFDRIAGKLASRADVLTVNLRGHFNGPAPRGDVSYVGQLEDDLSDLISAYRKDGQRVVLGGHSSGGGLVVRFAGGAHREQIDGAVLLAPFLKYDAPTTRPNSGGWAYPLTRRIIGLSMLNMVGIKALDHLTMMQFAMPEAVMQGPNAEQATLAYSWRLNKAFAPRNAYLEDVAALPEFLLIAGSADESFVAEGYQPLMSEVTSLGRYHVVDGVGHLDIVDAPETAVLMGEFLERFR
ncbi:alpha-beta hydrolase superfamily lysophospholipase [Shimia isoporae]|uniref:Alpha-beta hydrolase superfamily lysophospholipase n=1 Tax=Shimia isoporae TaxID=647720 RepID=A0A4R1NMG8_9RHOB|nr:alpha/beta hydrolase [Shimia isoporae]TCL09626.1 alpha-beta hydrolase superfamily lysophospholipase [Shimia isoporae]